MATGTVYDPEEKIWSGPEYALGDQNISFGQMLLDRLKVHGNKLMQINHDNGYQMSAREMRLKSLRIAASLTALGIGPGDIVQIVVSEHDDLVPLWLGIIAAGAGMNALHVSFSEHEMTHFIDQVEPKMIICEEHLVPLVRKGLTNNKRSAILYTFNKSIDAELQSVDDLVFGWEAEHFKYELPNVGDLTQSLAIIMCTSGTTGMPKAVRISHAMAKYGLFKQWPCEDGLVLFSASSLYWISALSTIVMAITLRMVRVITLQPFTPPFVLDVAEQHKVNILFTATNTIATVTELMRNRKYDFSKLNMIQTSGSLLSAATRDAFKEQYKGMGMFIYGLCDAACGIAISYSVAKVMSTGKLMPGVRIKLIDEATGRHLGPNETGELCLKTPVPLLGYMKVGTSNKDAFIADGWFRTGDLGYFDDDGELYLVDRQKDMIKYQGYQVAPNDVEAVIEKHCNVDSVVVVGIPDKTADGMFLPAAVVVRSDKNANVTEAEISKVVEENMMDCKRLRGGVYFVNKLPRTISGKLQRNEVAKTAMDLFLENQAL